jgi:hypothetical protein
MDKAVDYSSRADGYLENPQIKFPMPEKSKPGTRTQK